MSTRSRAFVALFVLVLVSAAGIVFWNQSSSPAFLTGAFGERQCVEIATTGPATVQHQGPVVAAGDAPHPSTIDAAGRIQLRLQRSFPSLFSGLSLSNDNATIDVYATTLSPGLKAAVGNLDPEGWVRYYRCRNTLSSLYSVQGALLAKWAGLTHQGIDVAGFGTTITSNCEEIDVIHLTQVQLVLLRQEFGADKVCIRSTEALNRDKHLG